MHLVIVQQGEFATYEQLTVRLWKDGGVRVIWDRRERDRRTPVPPEGSDRRQRERRHVPPATWSTLGFLMVRDDARA